MKKLFAVTRVLGPAWNHQLPLDQQQDWRAHADFMNALHHDGFILLGGPLEGTADVLLIIRALHHLEIQSRLAADPWTRSQLLLIRQIAPWTLRLGSLP